MRNYYSLLNLDVNAELRDIEVAIDWNKRVVEFEVDDGHDFLD